MKQAQKLALCGILAALSVVILIAGAILGLGIYAAPMFAGILLLPVSLECGRKYHILTWISVSLLAFLFVTDLEEKLIYTFLLGWYPILRPSLQKLKKPLRILVKVILFNGITVGLEALLLLVLAPSGEVTGNLLLIGLLVLANIVFYLYDLLLPRFALLYQQRFRKHLTFFR